MNFKHLIFLFIWISLFTEAFAASNFSYEIHGISGDLLKNVQMRLSADEVLQKEKMDSAGIKHFYGRAAEEIRQALQPFGYFKPEITSSLFNQKGAWLAIFHVELGPPIRIHEIDLQVTGAGKSDPEIKNYLKNLPLRVGAPFKVADYESVKEDLFHVANNQGYIKANLVKNQILIDHRLYEVKIILHFQTGKQYFFGPVTFESTGYSENFLNKFIPFDKNQPFSSERLITLQQAMASSYFFDQVVITPEFDQVTEQHIPVRINAHPPKAKKFSFGVGYGTQTGPRFTAGVTLRHIGKEGHHLNAQMRLSNILSGFSAQYFIPGTNPLTDQWVVGANFQKFSPQNGKSRSITMTGGYIRKLDHFQISSNLNFLIDRYSVSNAANPNEQYSKLLYPSINISYIDVDNIIDPKSGKSINFILQGATQYILSTTDFIQARLKTKYLFSPTSFSRVILRGDLGYTITHDINELPLSMRFFAGGLGSIRGYRDSSIGPGRYLAVGSIEYQHRLFGDIDGAVFYDVGNAMNHWGNSFSVGRGVGLIYRSIIGPIRVYAGQAITKESKPFHVDFSIGPEF